MTEPTIRIQFDRETLTPSAIFCDNGETDIETAALRKIADIMVAALPDREPASLEKPAP